MKESEIKGLRDICIFIILFYIKSWFQAASAIQAPQTDLTLLQNLIKFRTANVKVADAAISKVLGHLWYLTEETAAIAYFDEGVPKAVKIKMRDAMKSVTDAQVDLKRIRGNTGQYNEILQKDLSDFVSQKSLFIFELLEISPDFLRKDPDEWKTDEHFLLGLEVVRSLRVTNDVAERGVALIQELNNCLTKSEEQTQYLLQVVQQHRQKFKNPNIENFVRNVK